MHLIPSVIFQKLVILCFNKNNRYIYISYLELWPLMNRLFVNNNRRDTYVVCCFSNPFVKVQTRMDAIKAKMKKLTSETEEATVKANKFEAEAQQACGEAEKIEHSLAVLQKKYQSQVD